MLYLPSILFLFIVPSHAFVAKPRRARSSYSTLAADSSVPELVNKDGALDSASLKFVADFSMTSSPLADASVEDVKAFVHSPDFPRLVLCGDDEDRVASEEATPALLDMWTRTCEETYGLEYLPADGDRILTATTSINFPGLKLFTTTCSGVKVKEGDDGFLEHNFVLFAEKRDPQGLAPVVWIFNQLTGASKRDDNQYSFADGRAKTRVSVVEIDGEYCLEFDCSFVISVNFPKTLMRILPSSKEKMEEQGSVAIAKTVKAEVTKSAKTTEEAFTRFKAGSIST